MVYLDDFARLPERGTLRRILLRGKVKRFRYIVGGNLVCSNWGHAIRSVYRSIGNSR